MALLQYNDSEARKNFVTELLSALNFDILFPAEDPLNSEIRTWIGAEDDPVTSITNWLGYSVKDETREQKETREDLFVKYTDMLHAFSKLKDSLNPENANPEDSWNKAMEGLSREKLSDLRDALNAYNEVTDYERQSETQMQVLNGMIRGLTNVVNQIDQRAASELYYNADNFHLPMYTEAHNFNSYCAALKENSVVDGHPVEIGSVNQTLEEVEDEQEATKKEIKTWNKKMQEAAEEVEAAEENSKLTDLKAKYVAAGNKAERYEATKGMLKHFQDKNDPRASETTKKILLRLANDPREAAKYNKETQEDAKKKADESRQKARDIQKYLGLLKDKEELLKKAAKPLSKISWAGECLENMFADKRQFKKDREYKATRQQMMVTCGDARLSGIKEQLKNMYDRIDKSRRWLHSDSKEFNAMRTALEDVFGKDGKEDKGLTAEKLENIRVAADKYLKEKEGGLHPVTTNMRQYRLAFARELKDISSAGVKAAGKVAAENTMIKSMKDVVVLELVENRRMLNGVVKRNLPGPKEGEVSFQANLKNRLGEMNREIANQAKKLPQAEARVL